MIDDTLSQRILYIVHQSGVKSQPHMLSFRNLSDLCPAFPPARSATTTAKLEPYSLAGRDSSSALYAIFLSSGKTGCP